MSKPNRWFPVNVDRMAGETMTLTAEQIGAYVLLKMAYWRNQGPLPDDDESFASAAKVALPAWRKMRAKIAVFFVVENGLWTSTELEEELAKAQTTFGQKSKAGKASAEAKKLARQTNGADHEPATAVATAVDAAAVTGRATEPQRTGNGDPDGSATLLPLTLTDASSEASSRAAARDLAKRAVEISDALQAICGTDQNRHRAWAVVAPITGWLQAGADPDLDIFPAVRAVMARRNAKSEGAPASPAYLTAAVMDALAARSGSKPPATPSAPADPEREAAAKLFNAAMDAWVEGGRNGPMPELASYLPKREAA